MKRIALGFFSLLTLTLGAAGCGIATDAYDCAELCDVKTACVQGHDNGACRDACFKAARESTAQENAIRSCDACLAGKTTCDQKLACFQGCPQVP